MSSRFSKLELPEAVGGEPQLDAPTKASTAARPLALADEARARGDHEAALRYYARALGENAGLEVAWLGQVLCLVDLGELDEGLAWADRALGMFPDSGDLLALKAVAHARKGDVDKALGFSDAALKKDRAGELSWWARGDVLLGHNERIAEHCFKKASANGSGLLDLAIGRSYLSVNKPGAARRWFQEAVEKLPDNPIAWQHLGLAGKELGLFDSARAAYGEALRLRPGFQPARDALSALDTMSWLARAWAWIRRK